MHAATDPTPTRACARCLEHLPRAAFPHPLGIRDDRVCLSCHHEASLQALARDMEREAAELRAREIEDLNTERPAWHDALFMLAGLAAAIIIGAMIGGAL